jgi:hypothetical protein
VCVNILSNVESNAELHHRGPTEHDVFHASYGSIQVVPLTWGDDVPAFLNVTIPLRPPISFPFVIVFVIYFSRYAQSTANLILASDCVFKESLVAPFLAVVKRVLAGRGTAIVANEFRSASVHSTFLKVRTLPASYAQLLTVLQEAEAMFSVFLIPTNLIPAKFRHPMIQLYSLTALQPAEQEPSSYEKASGDE